MHELQGVVDDGTGHRLDTPESFDGVNARFGGKTGTGNNVTRNRYGQILQVNNRTATWTFTLGDETNPTRFYGTVLLYINGQQIRDPSTGAIFNPAARAHFTSAEAVITTKLIFSLPAAQHELKLAFNTPLPPPAKHLASNTNARQSALDALLKNSVAENLLPPPPPQPAHTSYSMFSAECPRNAALKAPKAPEVN